MSIKDIINEMVDNPEFVQADSLIDDSSLPLAKNIIDFVSNPVYINNMFPTPLYGRQFEVAVKTLGEYCPHCTDMAWWGTTDIPSQMPVDATYEDIFNHVTLLEHGICPKCGKTKSDFYNENSAFSPVEFVGVIGQRSGKSALIAIIITYIIHWLLKTPNLQKAYKLLPASPFMIPLIALNWTKAKDLLFQPIRKYLMFGNWFLSYHKFLDAERKRLKLKNDLYSIGESYAVYYHKNLDIRPVVTDKRKLRGQTGLVAAIDELSHMHGATDGVIFDPDEIYTSVNNSMATAQTMFYKRLASGVCNLPVPLMISISSPASIDDKAVRLYKESINMPRSYGLNLPTWLFNPEQPYSALKHMEAKDPKKFARDFGADPSAGAADTFIPESGVERIFSLGKRENAFSTLKYFEDIDKYTDEATGKIVEYKFTNATVDIERVKFLTGPKTPICMTIDCGEVNNSFTITIGTRTTNDDIIIIGIGEVIGSVTAPINFEKIYENIILPICKNLNVKRVASDYWQSVMLKGRLKLEHIDYRQNSSIKYLDYKVLRDLAINGKLILPKLEDGVHTSQNLIDSIIRLRTNSDIPYPHCFSKKPVAHSYHQYLFVNDTGKEVKKSSLCTDDILFTQVLLVNQLHTDWYYSTEFRPETNTFSNINSALAVTGRTSMIGSLNNIYTGNSVQDLNGTAIAARADCPIQDPYNTNFLAAR